MCHYLALKTGCIGTFLVLRDALWYWKSSAWLGIDVMIDEGKSTSLKLF